MHEGLHFCFLFISKDQILKYTCAYQTSIPRSWFLQACNFCHFLGKVAFNFFPNWSYTHKESFVITCSLREKLNDEIVCKKRKLAFVEHFVPSVEFEWSIYLIICFHGVESSLKPRQLKWFTFQWKVTWLICNDTIYLVIMTFLEFGQENKGWFTS